MSIPKTMTLPTAMDSRLRAIRRQQLLFGLLQTGALAGAVFLTSLLIALLIDWKWMLRDPRLRVGLTVSTWLSACLVAFTVAWWRLRPILQTAWAAMRADASIPQLEERWTTVVTMTHSVRQPTTNTARAMLQQVIHEAAAMGRLVQPRVIAKPEASYWSMMVLAVCAVVLLGFLSTDWPQTSVLLRRFWHPTADITATQLTSHPGDAVVPRGNSLDLTAELTGVPRSQAQFLVQHDDGPVDTIPLTNISGNPRLFLHRLRVDDSFRYQVRAGDGVTAWYTVRAVDPPVLADVEFVIDPPSYVTRARLEKTHIPSRVKVLQGSRLSLRMRATNPLSRCELVLTGSSAGAASTVSALTANTDGWYHFETVLNDDLTLVAHLWNEHQLTNEDPVNCRIQVIPDQAPVARILGSNSEAAVANDDVLKIEFEAHDDQGIASAQLVVYDESGVEKGEPPRILHVQEIPLGNQELQKHVLASLELDLKKLNLEPGSQISYSIRVMDNRMVNLDPNRDAPSVLADRDADAETEPNENSAMPNPPRSQRGKPSTMTKSKNGDEMIREMVGNDRDTDDVAMNAEESKASSKTGNTSKEGNSKGSSGKSTDQDEATDSTPSVAKAGDEGNNPNDDAMTAAENGDFPISALFPENVATIAANNDSDRRGVSTKSDVATRTPPSPRGDGTAESPTESVAVRSSPRAMADKDASTAPATDKKAGTAPEGNAVAATETPPPSTEAMTNEASQASSPGKTHQRKASASKQSESVENPVNIVVNDLNEDADTDSAAGDANATTTTATDKRKSSHEERPTFTAQLMDGQQDAETNRRRIRITERQAAVAAAKERQEKLLNVRERVVEIDRRLEAIETGLTFVVDRKIPDADRPQHLQQIDQRLGDIEKALAQLRSETRDGQFAFVGLQMVDIGRVHVTPARERVFVALREPDVGTDRNSTLALQSILRARELLAALLLRYDRVEQDRKLADGLEESAKMYDIYIEKAHQLMREARQTKNPLERKMAILELDQDYLDRYAEVQMLRREMLAEFARVLGDDPRLLSRYLQLSKGRRSSLREQLSQTAERQKEITAEVHGWTQVQEGQREDLFAVLVETRLQLATPLAKDAAELAEHVEQQLPLVLEPIQGTSQRVVKTAQELTATARDIALDVRRKLRDPDADIDWTARSQSLIRLCQELEVALDRLNFENEQQEEVVEYVTTRLLETRVVADHAARWGWIVEMITQKRFAGLAELDQQHLALSTELLRVDMLGIEAGLQTEFGQQDGAAVPADVLEIVRQMHAVMEAATFNQAAATFAFAQDQVAEAAAQQQQAERQLAQAENLFDEIRRKVVAALDELPPRDPNIADLRDPSLDEFLAGLEREPNIEAQLGLPNRRQNLRVIADQLEWQESAAGMIGQSGDEANERAMESQEESERKGQTQTAEREMTDEERKERQQTEQREQDLAKALTELQDHAEDPAISPEERERLEKLIQGMQQFAEQSQRGRVSPQLWNQLALSDQAKAAVAALAAGKKIPDQQWNKLMSALDDGLLQVGGRTPPAEYRRAIEQYQNRLRRMLDGATTKSE